MSTTNHIEETTGRADARPDARGMRFGIVVSEWNHRVTDALRQGAVDTLAACGAAESDVTVMTVPGSFELVFGASQFIRHAQVDAVIVLGCVIQGDTPHFTYVCQGVTQGVAELNATSDVPVIFGVLTTNDMEQALARAGGELGNKGSECVLTAIKMVNFAWTFQKK